MLRSQPALTGVSERGFWELSREFSMRLASRMERVTPSLTLAIDAKAKAMRADGMDLCNFAVGEPDFDTPSHIVKAAQDALSAGKTRYGPAQGELKLRQLIASKIAQENGVPMTPDQVTVTNGGKHSLFNAILALIQPGDEVIIPAPYWVSYPDMVALAGGTSVVVETSLEQGFRMSPQQFAAAVTPQTRMLILNSPSNPTGAMYSREELEAIASIAVERGVVVLSDEIYESLSYGKSHVSIASLNETIRAQTLISNGFAKGFAMTGWRVGYLAGPKAVIAAVNRIQGHSTSNVCTFAQYGAMAALEADKKCVQTMLAAFTERRVFLCGELAKIPGIRFFEPDGAFYVFIDISAFGLSSIDFAERFLDEEKVAATPGVAFGADRYIRFSFATDINTLRKGVERLARFVGRLK